MFKEVIMVHAPEMLSTALERDKWDALKDRYYKLRGWNVDTGRPERATLESLDMKEVADGLEDAGKLGGAHDGRWMRGRWMRDASHTPAALAVASASSLQPSACSFPSACPSPPACSLPSPCPPRPHHH
jgi:hypothetical protein